MYRTLRPLIYRLTPEQAHHVTIACCGLAGSLPPAAALLRALFRPARPGPAVQAFGLNFANPLGMAAGYDKDGLGWRGLACLGFGHIEVGTVTPRPQPGNPQPRLFRLVEDQAVINRMGFNNQGAAFLAAACAASARPGWCWASTSARTKSPRSKMPARITSAWCAPLPRWRLPGRQRQLAQHARLRSLQSRQALEGLLQPLAEEKDAQARRLGRAVPVLVKLAPDLDDAELEDALRPSQDAGMDGVIISNTTMRARRCARRTQARPAGCRRAAA
jgi:dihydroorotate dehydrogenase